MNSVQLQQLPAHPVFDTPFRAAILTAITNSPLSEDLTVSADEATNTDATDRTPVKPANRVTKKSIAEKFDLKKKGFQAALLDIFAQGMKFQAAIDAPVSNAAIPGLAKILGTHCIYFENADDVERAKFLQILTQQCRTNFGSSAMSKSDKRTTEWHLLSRMFRQSDRRQASADAKILKFAHAEGITEQTFPAWVKKFGTLSKILKNIPPESPESNAVPKKTTKAKPRYELVDRTNIPETEPQQALDAMTKLADGKVYQIYIYHHQGRFEIVRYKLATPKVPDTNSGSTSVAGPQNNGAAAAEKTEERVQ